MNVILMILDALRYDHVKKEITPNLVKIASYGVSFTHAFSCNSATKLSLPCILSSHMDYDPEKNIATMLNQYGYHTAMIHSNPRNHLFYSGFKELFDLKSSKSPTRTDLRKKMRRAYFFARARARAGGPILSSLKKVRAARARNEEKYLPYSRAEDTINFALNWMEGQRKYFLWVHLMDPHIPYYPKNSNQELPRKEIIELNDKIIEAAHGNYQPTEEEVDLIKTLYKEEIGGMDVELGRFFEKFNNEDLLIITSDHGDEFNEYGGFSHPVNKIIPELIHVPLIICGGGVRKGVIDDYVSHLSIAPTIFEALDISENLGLGKSLWKSLIT